MATAPTQTDTSPAYPADETARLLLRITTALSEALTPVQVADVIVEHAFTVLGGNMGSVALLTPDGMSIATISARGFPDDMQHRFKDPTPLDVVMPMTDAVRSSQAVWIETPDDFAAHYPHLAQTLEQHPYPRALACLPMIVNGRVTGSIGICFPNNKHFTETDRLFLLALSHQCGQALERARLYDAEASARAQMNLLYQISERLASAYTLEQATETVIEATVNMLSSHITSIGLITSDGQSLEIISSNAMQRDVVRDFRLMPLSYETVITDAARLGEAVWVETREEYIGRYPHIAPVIQNITHSQAAIGLPLVVSERVIGSLGMAFLNPRRFDARVRDFMLTLAHQCALALERARLYDAEQAARRAAEDANALKLKFLGMISHELRTPLTAIKGFATTLLADDVDFTPDEQRHFLGIMDEEADKLSALVEQLIDLSRLQAGSFSIYPEPRQWASVIRAAEAQLRTLTREHPLEMRLDDPLPLVMVDVERAAQVLANLVSNAVKFSPEGSAIGISATVCGDWVQINVRDEGIGIVPGERERVFEPFRQSERRADRGRKGAGLGLAICKGIVEAHGGQIWIQNVTSGTTVSFTLPIARV
jgi:K+-sensing histidine kinase KdpD